VRYRSGGRFKRRGDLIARPLPLIRICHSPVIPTVIAPVYKIRSNAENRNCRR
jgi:hypothetical protein